MKVTQLAFSVVAVFLLVFLCVIGLGALGFLDFRWPWEDLEVATEETTITFDEEEPEPQVVRIEPIALDCRARVHAEVPVRASRTHELVGQTYRTDTVEMVAVGDVDTCLDASSVEIAERVDGSWDVIIPAESIEFVRPRVDAVATMNSVYYDKGLVGKITDAFPWVSDNDGLTPAAYAFAQSVVGGSDCMDKAYELTELALQQAYTDQMVEQGGEETSVEVLIVGTPDFGQNDLPSDPAFEDFDFTIDGQSAVCEIADTAWGGAVATSGDS